MTQTRFNEMMEVYLELGKEKTASNWAKRTWSDATSKKIFDGTSPQGFLTREQFSAVVLDRLKLA